MAFAGWVVVITMDGENRNGDIDVGVLIIDMIE